MRKKKWVEPFLESEKEYLADDFIGVTFDRPVHVEIGMGMGDFITESAESNKDNLYVGLEREATCVARSIKKARDKGLDNFRVILDDASDIGELFSPDSIDVIYLHFSDPWPKKRNHKRRLTFPTFLSKYQDVLKNGGTIILKTDNEGFFDDSLGYFSASAFELLETDRNYRNDSEPMTAYQAKFVREGKPIYYAKYIIHKV